MGMAPIEFPKFIPLYKKSTCKVSTKCSNQLVRKLNEQKHLFEILLTGFVSLLSRYVDQTDFLIGLPKEKQVLKIQISLERSFNELFAEVENRLKEKFSSELLPSVEFIYKGAPPKATTKELVLHIEEKKERFGFTFLSSPGRFPITFLKGMAQNFEHFLAGLLQSPEKAIGSISCVHPEEEKRILKFAVGEKRPYPGQESIPSLFEKIAEKESTKTALICEGKTLSYQLLNQSSNRLSRHLQTLGVKKGDIVALSMDRSFDAVIGLLAILKLGAAYIPIDTAYPVDRKQYMIENSQAKLLITHEKEKKHFPIKGLSFFFMDTQQKDYEKYSESNLDVSIEPTSISNVLFTSGSTGRPKGIDLDHRGMLHLVCNSNWLDIIPKDRVLQIANTSFDVMGMEVWGALLNGATLCIYHPVKLSMDELAEFIIHEKVNYAFFTARLFNLMVEHKIHELKNLRFISSCGEAMSTHYAKIAFKSLPKCKIANVYGPAENSVVTCAYPIRSLEDIKEGVPIGPPVSGTSVYILNPYLQLVPIGVNGELFTGGDGIAHGYHNRPDLTEQKFIDNPLGTGKVYRSGDVARFLFSGDVDFKGRLDTQVKIAGFRIELEEIEKVLEEHPKVANAAVVVYEFAEGDNKLAAYIEPSTKITFTSKEAKAYLETKLPEFMIPAFIVIMEKLPLTPNGKIDRKALPEPVIQREIKPGDLPSTPTEKLIAEIWESLLHIPSISRKDNFFQLGGNSIASAKLDTFLSSKFSFPIPVGLIFEEPVLEDYAKRIDQLLIPGKQQYYLTDADLFWIWRNKEVRLDTKIKGYNKEIPKTQYTKPKKFFLTGSTGFVGSFMLAELLENTNAKVYCLVRAENESDALNRIIDALKKYKLYQPKLKKRILAVQGDLALSHLGLEKKIYKEIAQQADSIIHIAALVNHTLPYAQLKSANVVGTEEILKLASRGRVKPFHFISTPDVFEANKPELIKEDKNIDEARFLTNGYAQSKWVGEKLSLIAQARGIPINIFRLGRVNGDSKTGANNPEDFLWRMAEASLLLKLAPDIGLKENIAPVDFCCKAIRIIAMNPKWINGIYHVFNSEQYLYSDIFKFFQKIGYSLRFVTYQEWLEALIKYSLKSNKSRLQASAVLFSNVDLTHPELLPQFGTSNFEKALKKSGLTCPQLDAKLLKKSVDYFISIGILPRYR